MTDLTRRNALKALAVAAVATGAGAGAAAAACATDGGLPPGQLPEAAVRAAREAASRLGSPAQGRGPGSIAEAHVVLCRAWDRLVYLYVDEDVRGFAPVTESAFAVAAACRAAGRRVALQHWGYDPGWAGVGRFEGVLLAVDRTDLPTPPSEETSPCAV